MLFFADGRSVLLPRFHSFEFNDQAWVPASMREILTYAIGQGVVAAGAGSPMGQVLASIVEESRTTSILELAAGSAVPSIELVNELVQRGAAVNYVVSDKYPDLEDFRRASRITQGRVTYIEQPVDALTPPSNLQGLRLLVTSFHHFAPEQAVRIFRGAYESGFPVTIFEFTNRRLLRTLCVGPLAVLFMFILLPKILKVYLWRGALWFSRSPLAFARDGLSPACGPVRCGNSPR